MTSPVDRLYPDWRSEAIRRLEEADRLFAEHLTDHPDSPAKRSQMIAHARQTAVVCALLSLPLGR